jgi:hypothetical protein
LFAGENFEKNLIFKLCKLIFYVLELRYFLRCFYTPKYGFFTRQKDPCFTQQKYQTFVVLKPYFLYNKKCRSWPVKFTRIQRKIAQHMCCCCFHNILKYFYTTKVHFWPNSIKIIESKLEQFINTYAITSNPFLRNSCSSIYSSLGCNPTLILIAHIFLDCIRYLSLFLIPYSVFFNIIRTWKCALVGVYVYVCLFVCSGQRAPEMGIFKRKKITQLKVVE